MVSAPLYSDLPDSLVGSEVGPSEGNEKNERKMEVEGKGRGRRGRGEGRSDAKKEGERERKGQGRGPSHTNPFFFLFDKLTTDYTATLRRESYELSHLNCTASSE